MKKLKILFTTLIGLIGLFIGGGMINVDVENMIESFMIQTNSQPVKELGEIKIDEIKSTVNVNGNYANFTLEELELTEPWHTFSDLDSLNRVGVADALLHKSMMPSEPREDISMIYPTGWNQKKLDDGNWLYNRSHLLGFQLTGENANWKNLFTGTQELNQIHMVKYENEIAQYLKSTNNHVRYRVTPIFIDTELVPCAIQLEAKSIEDKQIDFNVLIPNIQTGITIDYSTGEATKE
ncbi:DNA-entry nuclease (Competence-specific nuclease) [Enterococcus mundtii 1A]|uniref:DNA/RNA non-specific endonuclease n=1 Tax=Enterococcus mundtii TaxID=53346 RepID=UPI002302110A|nr:DNA/RNA non-specific endonuclease [Enterococcus mundtii]MDA9429890.1 DNA-entry nuclease (Competence-specific nuclease) [Enterococcus mundtii 1A]